MGKVIATMNHKGGAGKTSTAAALAAGLPLKGYTTLAIDLDAQGNLSYSAGVNKDSAISSMKILTGEVKAADAIQHTKQGFDIIPASRALSGADMILTQTGKEYRLREALEPILSAYDFIVIDTAPALGILSINALTAANSIIIPAQADIYSLQGIDQLADTISPVRKYTNRDLAIDGILLTRYSPRSVLSREVASLADETAARLDTKVFKAAIREAIVLKEAQLMRRSLFEYAPKAKVTEDYSSFIEELLEGGQTNGSGKE